MNKIIFDIETLAPEFNDLNPTVQEDLIEKFSKDVPEKDREKIIALIEDRLGLLPQFSKIIAISFYNPDTKKGAVHFLAPKDFSNWSEESIEFKCFQEEKELLTEFWKIIPNYQEIISYNGNNFDIPFILFRSLVCHIKPTIDLLNKDCHIDLYQILSFNRRISHLSLKFLSISLNIEDPKKNIDGRKIRNLVKSGDYQSLVKYAIGDVMATAEIYNLWNNYLRFI
jgi:DNA polymerase I